MRSTDEKRDFYPSEAILVQSLKILSIATVLGAAVAASDEAHAQNIIRIPGDHPHYSVEIEPHGLLGWGHYSGSNAGFGLGGRFSIPIVQNGFVPTINNSVAIGFGLDWVHYSGCYWNIDSGCSANYVFIPVVLQWNFWLTPQWSVFGEPGISIYHGMFNNDICNGILGCHTPTTTSVDPAFYVGGRYHFNARTSLTMRVGYPTISIGVSFFP